VTHLPLRTERLHATADLARASERKRDAALLRATAELFVIDVVHSDDEIRRFEELATHFLPKVGLDDRQFVAERLAACSDAPGSVLRALAKEPLAVATPVLLHATALTAIDLLAIIAATGIEHHRLIAHRSGLPEEVVQALKLKGDAEVLALLDQTTAEAPRDLDRTLPAAGLYQSNRLDPWRYLALDRPARLRIIADIAANPPPAPEETSPRRLDRAFRSILSAARIVGYARSGQLGAIVASIAEGLDVAPALVTAAVNDKGGETLAIMLKALRLDDTQARQVFLLASPTGRDTQAFFPLADLYAGMEVSVAETMVEAWRGATAPVQPRYEPLVEAPRERRSAAVAKPAADGVMRRDETARRA
jgi:uncharacterized protein (DUF2336 family)